MRPLIAVLLVTACVSEPTDEVTEIASSELTISAIPRRSTWRYWDKGGSLGTTWRGVFDHEAWASGAGPLGYGESYLFTTVGYGPSASSKYITTYFRNTFTVDDPDAVIAMTGEVMYDDGFVVYLNGVELQRTGLPSGTITASTLSSGHEANNAYATYDWTAHAGALVAGTNVLAFEVHQQAASSSDLVFDASLTLEIGEPAPPPVDLGGIRRNDFWFYWEGAAVPNADWKLQTCCPDEPWLHGYGVFGYGESYLTTTLSYGSDPANKPVTAYFTATLSTVNLSAVTGLVAEVMYDDGFVAYLNGVEVARRRMPTGAITHTTLSTGHEANNTYETIDLSSWIHLLDGDDDVFAVEVHQQARSSSDLVFDASVRMMGEEPPPPPAEEDIARGSVWAYYDDRVPPDPYGFWQYPEFNDAQWGRGPGPLGYGESYIATPTSYGGDPADKPVTTFFRRWITVDNPSVQTRLYAEVMYDDGFALYINGNRTIVRGLPESHDYGTLAAGHEASNSYEFIDLTPYNSLLVPGPNLIAVEVHQQARSSSDLVFDLALYVDTPAVCALLGGGAGTPPSPSTSLNDVWVGPTSVIAVGAGGTVGRRTDASGAWCWGVLEPETHWVAAWGHDDDAVWLVGSGGRVLNFDGGSFEAVDIGATQTLRDVWGTGPDDIWIVGQGGTIRHFDGVSWQAHDLPSDHTVQSVWSASPDDVWVAGRLPAPYPGNPDYDGSTAFIDRWDPAAQSWTRAYQSTMYYGFTDFSGLHGTSATDIWAVGADHPAGAACGTFSHVKHFDGTSWSTPAGAPTDDCTGLEDVAAGGPGAEGGAWLVGAGEDPGTGRLIGGEWFVQVEPSSRNLTAVDHLGDRMWAVGRKSYSRHTISRWNGIQWIQDW